jgi:two-component system cell cycle sensor histidine kinase/response regulator CckA
MVSQRSIAQVFLAVQAALTACLAILLFAQHNVHASAAVIASALYAACFIAFRRGWEPARHVVVISLTLLLVSATSEPYLTERPMIAVMVPPIVALMLTSASWIVGSAALGLVGLAVRSGFQTPLLEPLDLLVFIMSVSGLVLARRSVDVALTRFAAQTATAEAARKQAEAAAREAIAERDRAANLEEALRHMQRLESVGRLAGGVAHDFNNLLTVIGASTSMAERSLASGQSVAADLEEIQLAVGRASELTKQLLAFARKQVLVKRNVELNELVSNIERMLGRLIGQEATLCARLSSEPLHVLADAGQIEQVLVNLVINARDAITGRGQIEICTRRTSVAGRSLQDLDALPCGEYACIEVKDTGVGMSEDVQRRLFEPFFTTKPPGRGTGLGLATSFGIVRQHEGGIRVDSRVGRGTIMRVLLPLAAAAQPATSGVVPVASRPRVLVVEDEPQVRAIAARALTSAGFEVEQASNGAVALGLVRKQTAPFDVIVTDVVMPELTGPELARAVRKLDSRQGLVFMSGFPEAMHGTGPDEFTGAAYLTKPFAPQALVAAVRSRLEHQRELRQQASG